MFDKFEIVMIVVSDMDRSVRFYRDVLGLKLKIQSPGFSEFDVGSVALGLHPEGEHLKAQDADKSGASFGFATKNMEATVRTLKERGVRFIMEPRDEGFGILAVFADPDGYNIQLVQKK